MRQVEPGPVPAADPKEAVTTTGLDTVGAHAVPAASGSSPRPRLLLVEDDAGDALLVEELLLDSGVEADITWVTTLAGAEKALAQEPPQCVLLDLHLPDGSGAAALDRVLRAAGAAAVVVLTGLAEEESGAAAVAAGAQDYLIKGAVEPELFGRALRYAMHRKQAERYAAALQAEQLRAQENVRLERGLLPEPLLPSRRVRVSARYRPGRAQALLGGDFYDVVEADDGSVHAIVGDVSGHGPDEAALGVCLRIAWRTAVLSGTTGGSALALLERMLLAERSGPEIFATVCAVVIRPGERGAQVWRAGHPGVLVRGGGGRVDLVEPEFGPALGLLPGLAQWPCGRVEVPDGGSLVMFTDGLFEGRTSASGAARLGEDGLLELAREHAALPGVRFVDAVIEKAEAVCAVGGGLADDVAVVQVEWS
ncbi:PP2C family protein-serine/threonine phosphatase [Streptomyces sp. NPDC059637]|uniref:PP2C family protein-serine/threonine phosphatase n=1 Tax=Streptomyces sp. NPDC059637 TaxID=3347752 RepID=UPI0036C7FD1D